MRIKLKLLVLSSFSSVLMAFPITAVANATPVKERALYFLPQKVHPRCRKGLSLRKNGPKRNGLLCLPWV